MIGKTVSHYKIISKLGEGGMGEVWEAHDSHLDRTVAIKLIPKHLSADPGARKRFVHEAKAASSIEHANICTIHEIDETPDGETFIVMPRYQGELLSDRITRGRPPLDEALRIVEDLAGALAEAHDHDIVHRDVKPENIIIDPNGRPILLDFGLAKLTEHTKVTKTGMTVGTLSYMAPEQAAGKEVDGRADLFSLGVVLYELVTGVRPFRGDHDAAVLYSIAHEPALALTSHDPELPDALQTIVDCCLAKDPNDRYTDLHALKAAIVELRHDLLITNESRPIKSNSGYFRKQWVLPAIALVVIVTVIAVWRFVPGNRGNVEVAEFALAVVDFRDLDNPDDLQASAGMTELVNIGLIENSPIRVVSPEYLRDLCRRLFGSGRGPIEDDQIIEVAQKAGATLLLAGRMGRVGDEQFVTWRLVDTHTGENVGAKKVEGDKLTVLVDRVVAGVLPIVAEVCGVETTGSPTALDRITTESEEAYWHFAAGLLFKDQFRGMQARDELETAVAIDSTFALAYLELARLYWGGIAELKDADRARSNLERARTLESRLGTKDRLRLEATLFDQDRQIAQAVTAYEQILERWPDDRTTLGDLANLFLRFWQISDAAAVAEKGLELYPDDIQFGSIYPQMLADLGRPEDALRITQEYVQRYPTDPNAWDDLASRFLALGLPDSAEVAARKSLDIDPFYGTGGGLPMCAYCRGDLGQAIALTEQYLARDDLPEPARFWRMAVQSVTMGLAAYYLEAGRYQKMIEAVDGARQYSQGYPSGWERAKASALLRAGRPKEALEIAHYVKGHYDDVRSAFSALRIRARVTVALGDLEAARAAVEELYAAQDRWGGFARAFALKAEAEIALAENKPAIALEALDKLKEQGVPSGGLFDITYREARARAYRMAGRLDEAAAEHEALLKVYGGHALSHYKLGLIYEEMKRPQDAKREFTKFLEMWAKADKGLPQLVDAKERLAALQ